MKKYSKHLIRYLKFVRFNSTPPLSKGLVSEASCNQTQNMYLFLLTDESSLPKYSLGSKLLTSAMRWMNNGKDSTKFATNFKFMDSNIAQFTDNDEEALSNGNFGGFFVGNYGTMSKKAVEKLKIFLENGGNLIVGSDDHRKIGGDRYAMRM